jgi:hypothetical protein
MWYIGQKVVCVNDRFPRRVLEWASNLPRKGQIYTIRSIGRGECIYTGQLRFGFKLEELQNAPRFGFFAERFAPLVDELDQACQRNAWELTSPAWVELPVLTPAARIPRAPRCALSPSHPPHRRFSKNVRAENAAIRIAVLRAVAQERRKSPFALFGRGHELRVSLGVSLAAILRGLDIPRVYISGYGANYYYPRRVFTSAIRTLKKKLGRSPIAGSYKVYRIRDVEDHLASRLRAM